MSQRNKAFLWDSFHSKVFKILLQNVRLGKKQNKTKHYPMREGHDVKSVF